MPLADNRPDNQIDYPNVSGGSKLLKTVLFNSSGNITDPDGGSLIHEKYDEIVLTYVAAGNGTGEIETATYKLATATVATLTLSYNGDNKLSGVVKS